jgi:hypothetical protein
VGARTTTTPNRRRLGSTASVTRAGRPRGVRGPCEPSGSARPANRQDSGVASSGGVRPAPFLPRYSLLGSRRLVCRRRLRGPRSWPANKGLVKDVLVLLDTGRCSPRRQADPVHRPGPGGQGEDRRDPRADTRHDSRGEIKQARWVQGAGGDAGGGPARGRADHPTGARAPRAADLRRRGHPRRPNVPPRRSSRMPAGASARSCSAPRTTPTRSSARSGSTSRSSTPPFSAAATASRGRTHRGSRSRS